MDTLSIAVLLFLGSVVGFIFGMVVISQLVFRRTIALMLVIWNIAAAEIGKTEEATVIIEQAHKVIGDPSQVAIAKTIAKAAVAGYDKRQQ